MARSPAAPAKTTGFTSGCTTTSQPFSGSATAHASGVSNVSLLLLVQLDRTLLSSLEAQAPQATGGNWAAGLGPDFLANLGRYRRYNVASLRDLLRVIRNKHNHFWELPEELQQQLGPLPEGFVRCRVCQSNRGKSEGKFCGGPNQRLPSSGLLLGSDSVWDAAAPLMLHWHTGGLWRGAVSRCEGLWWCDCFAALTQDLGGLRS